MIGLETSVVGHVWVVPDAPYQMYTRLVFDMVANYIKGKQQKCRAHYRPPGQYRQSQQDWGHKGCH